jgi:hypothetical protein
VTDLHVLGEALADGRGSLLVRSHGRLLSKWRET